MKQRAFSKTNTMDSAIRMILTGFCFGLLLSCNKEAPESATRLSVQLEGMTEDLYWEEVNGTWDKTAQFVLVQARGTRDEVFNLYLPGVTDTGAYPVLTSRTLYVSDQPHFTPTGAKGTIRISRPSATTIRGDFEVALTENEAPQRSRLASGYFVLLSPY